MVRSLVRYQREVEGFVRFGSYELVDKIGSGGMADVYRARAVDGDFARPLAIKRIREPLSGDPTWVQMFIEEARLTAELHHPNIVQVLDFGEHDGLYFLAMELVEGHDLAWLAERMEQEGPIPAPIAMYVCLEVLQALAHAHARRDARGRLLGLIHRDVSPANILISWEGEVKLTDFGIAKVRKRATETTQGRIKGKFGYMAPEQVRGEELDGRTDLFALGIVLYEILTGVPLFHAPSAAATIRRVMHAPVHPPSRENPRIPPELDAIVLKALARDAPLRYQSAEAFHADLLSCARGTTGTLLTGDLAAWMQRRKPALAAPSDYGDSDTRIERVVAGRMHGLLQAPAVRAPDPEPFLATRTRGFPELAGSNPETSPTAKRDARATRDDLPRQLRASRERQEPRQRTPEASLAEFPPEPLPGMLDELAGEGKSSTRRVAKMADRPIRPDTVPSPREVEDELHPSELMPESTRASLGANPVFDATLHSLPALDSVTQAVDEGRVEVTVVKLENWEASFEENPTALQGLDDPSDSLPHRVRPTDETQDALLALDDEFEELDSDSALTTAPAGPHGLRDIQDEFDIEPETAVSQPEVVPVSRPPSAEVLDYGDEFATMVRGGSRELPQPGFTGPLPKVDLDLETPRRYEQADEDDDEDDFQDDDSTAVSLMIDEDLLGKGGGEAARLPEMEVIVPREQFERERRDTLPTGLPIGAPPPPELAAGLPPDLPPELPPDEAGLYGFDADDDRTEAMPAMPDYLVGAKAYPSAEVLVSQDRVALDEHPSFEDDGSDDATAVNDAPQVGAELWPTPMGTPEGPPVEFRETNPESGEVGVGRADRVAPHPDGGTVRELPIPQDLPEPHHLQGQGLDDLDEPLFPEERPSRLLRWVGIVVIVVMLVAAGIGTYLLYERQQRRKAKRLRKRVAPSVLLDSKGSTRSRTSLRKFKPRTSVPSATSKPASMPSPTSKPTSATSAPPRLDAPGSR